MGPFWPPPPPHPTPVNKTTRTTSGITTTTSDALKSGYIWPNIPKLGIGCMLHVSRKPLPSSGMLWLYSFDSGFWLLSCLHFIVNPQSVIEYSKYCGWVGGGGVGGDTIFSIAFHSKYSGIQWLKCHPLICMTRRRLHFYFDPENLWHPILTRITVMQSENLWKK